MRQTVDRHAVPPRRKEAAMSTALEESRRHAIELTNEKIQAVKDFFTNIFRLDTTHRTEA
ncbi:hypothetical protein OPAG_07646 [Rhodococcus opacus PD630]|nr:hypothetical protein OPAG_07646 [Rhodococcus opacus PD630]